MSRILVYSDVHGNLPAFEAMLDHTGKCDGYISLGDIVNYGPWSNECVDLACSLPDSVFIMGNHEEAFIAGHYPGKNKLVGLFFEQTYSTFTRTDYIKKFQSNYRFMDHVYVHTIGNQYIYPDTSIALDDNYVIGHSHHQFIYKYRNFTLYNAGSVGQNRANINVINYLLFDPDSAEFELRQLTYDVDLVIDEMKRQQYPEECIHYYKNKARL